MKSLSEHLQMEDGTAGMINECLKLVKKSEKLVIFGAGAGGAALYNLLKKHGLEWKICGWADNNPLKFGKAYMDEKLQIFDPVTLVEKIGECEIIIASSAYDKIKKQLVSYGYSKERISLFNFAFMDLEYTDKQFIQDHLQDFERAYMRMGDDKSRRLFTSILNYRITKKENYLMNMQPDVDDEHYQYFPEDLLEFRSDECFLDIGAYTGDTLAVFDEIYKGKYSHYYGFEADTDVFRELRAAAAGMKNKDNINIYNLAAWDCKAELLFNKNAGSSTVTHQNTGISVNADSMDNIFGEGHKISFVKMDIEGAEYNALNGMKNIIKSNHPVLAVCVYHLRDDFYHITDFVESLAENEYSFFLRQYRYTVTETVCYMIPRDRMRTDCIL